MTQLLFRQWAKIAAVLFLLIAAPVLRGSAQSQITLPANQLRLPAASYEIDLRWMGDTVHASWEPYAALLLPVKLPGCPKQFYMQLDFGASFTLFYRDQVNAIRTRYPGLLPGTDTTSSLEHFGFLVGKMPVTGRRLPVRKMDSAAIDWNDTRNPVIIGTIGTDFIENKVVVLDYPGKKLWIGGEIPGRLQAGLQLSPFFFARRSVLLPAVIRGEKTLLYFDTGSSAYELLTDKATCERLAIPGSAPIAFAISAWNRTVTAHRYPVADSLEIASATVPIRNATYIEGASEAQVAQMKQLGIGGMTGNRLFIHRVLLLDTRNGKFGFLPGKKTGTKHTKKATSGSRGR